MEHQGQVLVNLDTDAYARDDGGAIIIETGINDVSGRDGRWMDLWWKNDQATRPPKETIVRSWW